VETEKCTSCPITRLLDVLSGRWALPVLFHLHQANGPIRFGQLQREIGRVTQKELTRTLREFEARGLVERRVFAEVPPRVEYRTTPLGESLREPICGLARWTEAHAEELDAAQRRVAGEA
jgi:DNA-binding HxlR family transcriptional regulator